jgi:hypothetical protein
MNTLFVPLIHRSRMATYAATDFAMATAVDGATELTFTPTADADLDVYLPGPAVIFFLRADETYALPGGPTVTPASDAVAMQLLNMDAILAEGRKVANPPPQFPSWWLIEGVKKNKFLDFVKRDEAEEDRQATRKGYNVGQFRDALGAGETSFNASCKDASGALMSEPLVLTKLAGQQGQPLTVRMSTWYAWELPPTQYSALPVATSLASIGKLNSSFATHPLVARAGDALLAEDLALHVKFQRWTPADAPPAVIAASGKGTFTALPAGTVVKLMKVNTSNTDERTAVASGIVEADGQVVFSPGAANPHALARSTLAVGAAEALAFEVESSQACVTQYQRDGAPRANPAHLGYITGDQIAEAWLTIGLAAAGGEPGSLRGLDTFPAASFGLPSAPITYNLGIPVFLQIDYARLLVNGITYSSTYEHAPKGVLVTIRNDADRDLGEFRTDEDGQVWGLVTTWDPKHTNIRVVVKYEMEDRPPDGSFYALGLPRVTGVVQSADPPPASGGIEEHFDSTWKDAQDVPFGPAGPFSAASLGTPSTLARVRVGAIGTHWLGVGDWRYESGYENQSGARTNKRLYGEHGGVLDAFKTLRHAHEWWHNLTDGVVDVTSDATLKKTWKELFDPLHRADSEAGLTVRVIFASDVTVRGGAGVVDGTDRLELKLFHPGAWHTLQQTANSTPGSPETLAPEALSLLWNRATIHHEFAHIVFLVATALNGANSAALAKGIADYDAEYDPLFVSAKTFTTLLEGVANFATLAVGSSNGTFSGATFGKKNGKWMVGVNNGSVTLVAIDSQKTDGDATTDPRLGLLVSGAVARAFWDCCSRAGATPALTVIPDPVKPDLRDEITVIKNADFRAFFQRVAWLPLRSLSVPDSDGRWPDLAGTAEFPTSFALVQHLATRPDCYSALADADKARVRDAFGTAAGAWCLWDTWP